MSVEFGPILDYARVEDAVTALVREWIDTYLVAVERENGLTPRTITRPRDWKVQDDLTVTPERDMPVLYVISAGETEDPVDTGGGHLSSTVSFGIVVAAKDTTRDATRVLARRYSAAVAALIDHKLGLAGLGIRLASTPRQQHDEAISQPTGTTRFIYALASVTFTAQVDTVRYSRGGPDQPFPEPPRPGHPDAPENPADPDRREINVHITTTEPA